MEKELGAKPSTETADLYEAILAEDPIEGVPLSREKKTARHIDLMSSLPISGPAPARPLFVGRADELTRLMGFMEEAVHGRGQVAFLVGDAGSGKSSLLTAFAEEASLAYEGLLVTRGACNAFSGRGDPYLPFRDGLSLLTGDVERAWASGTITTEQAKALWLALPYALQGLINYAPNLLDTMIPLRPLVSRVESVFPELYPQLTTLKDWIKTASAPSATEQLQLFEQVENLCQQLTKERPLLIMLDDLQWADEGSIALLFHLGRRLVGSRILIVGAYRQDEVTAVIDHPLSPLLDEFRRSFGDVWLDLNQAPGRAFVDAIIDSEANQLDETFRETLYQQTGGHPLFTVELLSDMQERGDLLRDESGVWMTGQSLDWQTLPARVEGVIASRIGRLGEGLRQILTVAAVEGEYFTAQIVAQVQGVIVRELAQQLSWEADKKHRLVKAQRIMHLGNQRLSQYNFRHNLIQKYLYNNLDEVERAYLHEEVGNALEELYGEQAKEIAAQLSWHFAEAGIAEKAVRYHIQAGQTANDQFVYDAAIAHYQKAIALLKEQRDFEQAAQISMKLAIIQHQLFNFQGAGQAYEEAFTLQQKSIAGESPALASASQTFRTTSQEPLTIDPTLYNQRTSANVIGNLFSGLVTLTPGMAIVPNVARTWEILEDGRKYIFHLRSDVRWTDGTAVTAHNFEYAWKRLLNPTLGAPVMANLMSDIKGARRFHQGLVSDSDGVGVIAFDEHTLVVELEQPASYFLYLLSNPITFPVPQHVIETYGETWTEVENFVSNGPFQLVAWEKGKMMRFKRNRSYHGPSTGNVEQVEIFIHRNEFATELAWYEAGQIDLFSTTSQNVREQYHEEMITFATPITFMLNFDKSRPPFVDARVRRALILATDRSGLSKVFGEYYGQLASGGLCPPAMPGHSAGIGLPYDPIQARKLLTEAGYSEGHNLPEIELYSSIFYQPLINYLKEQWLKNLGIQFVQVSMGSSIMEDVQQVQPALIISGWSADYPDPDSFLRVYHGRYFPGWRNEKFDQLLKEANNTIDQQKRLELYQQADKILIDDAVLMPIGYGRVSMLAQPWVNHVSYTSIFGLLWEDIIIEPH